MAKQGGRIEAATISLNKLKEELSVYEEYEKIKLDLKCFDNEQAELIKQKGELEQTKLSLVKQNKSWSNKLRI